ncbi:hypothetical protein DL96DRAFT_1686355 [Flagelloscypha sp. PMI_526]|nr:hypothetical protein DL96DRAFT_1686355 [Flagelloscypha sp. PMI_526]
MSSAKFIHIFSDDEMDYPGPAQSSSSCTSSVVDLTSDNDDDNDDILVLSQCERHDLSSCSLRRSVSTTTLGTVDLSSDDDDDVIVDPSHVWEHAQREFEAAKKRRLEDACFSDESPSKRRRSSDEQDFDVYSARGAKNSRTKKDKSADKAQAQAKRLAAREQKKADNVAAIAERKRLREEERQAKKDSLAAEKAAKARYKSANKIKLDKKIAVQEMSIVFSSSLVDDYPTLPQMLTQKLTTVGTSMRGMEQMGSLLEDHKTVRWNLRHKFEFSPQDRDWRVLAEPREEFERAALLWLDAEMLQFYLHDLSSLVQSFRDAHNLPNRDKHHVFILLFGLDNHRRATVRHREIQDALTALHTVHHTHYIYSETLEDAASRLYNLSADFAIKRDKLVQRSHLPFVYNSDSIKSGTSASDTYLQMLTQIHRVTLAHAKAIIALYPTMRGLRNGAKRHGEHFLADAEVGDLTQVGTQRRRTRMGPAMSKRVWSVVLGRDPLELVDKERK